MTRKLDPSTAIQSAFDAIDSMPLVSTFTQLVPNTVVELVPIRTPANGFGVRRARLVNKSSNVIAVYFQDARDAFSATGVFAEGVQVLGTTAVEMIFRDDLRLAAMATATSSINCSIEDK